MQGTFEVKAAAMQRIVSIVENLKYLYMLESLAERGQAQANSDLVELQIESLEVQLVHYVLEAMVTDDGVDPDEEIDLKPVPDSERQTVESLLALEADDDDTQPLHQSVAADF